MVPEPQSTLASRTRIYSEDFEFSAARLVNAARGRGPGGAISVGFPQPFRCLPSRVLAGRYMLRQVRVDQGRRWPIQRPEHVAVVDLQGETLCFRMRKLLFFEPSLRLSTIANLQPQWLAFEMPTIPCISGHGLVAFSVGSDAAVLSAGDSEGLQHHPSTEQATLDRLVAWSTDTQLCIDAASGWNNLLTYAPPGCSATAGSLVIVSRAHGENDSDLGVFARLLRFVLP
jgi:hypothetical protein